MQGWTRREDEALLQGYRNFKGNWEKIAAQVGSDKDAKECMNRIYKINFEKDITQFTTGGAQWTSDIDKKILLLQQQYGSNWTLISKYIPNKSTKQVRDRYSKVLQPQCIKASHFTPNDERRLISLFETYPNQWQRIAEFFVGKNPAVIKERFYQIKQTLPLIEPQCKKSKDQNTQFSETTLEATKNTNVVGSESLYKRNKCLSGAKNLTKLEKQTHGSEEGSTNEPSLFIPPFLDEESQLSGQRIVYSSQHINYSNRMKAIREKSLRESNSLISRKNQAKDLKRSQLSTQHIQTILDQNNKRNTDASVYTGSYGSMSVYNPSSELYLKQIEQQFGQVQNTSFNSERSKSLFDRQNHNASIVNSDMEMKVINGSLASYNSFLEGFSKERSQVAVEPQANYMQSPDFNRSLFQRVGTANAAEILNHVEEDHTMSINSSFQRLSISNRSNFTDKYLN